MHLADIQERIGAFRHTSPTLTSQFYSFTLFLSVPGHAQWSQPMTRYPRDNSRSDTPEDTFMTKTVLVSGAADFIGFAMATALSAQRSRGPSDCRW